jgi:hypothetical protein
MRGEFMTRYFVNEREIAPPLDISSLDQILKHVEGFHLPPNSAIRQIQVDGQPLISETYPDSGEILQQIENREKVEIFTGTVSEIAHDSIIEAIAYLNRIEAVTPSLSECFQNSPGPEAFGNLRQLLEGFYWINLLLDKLAASFHIEMDKGLVQGISIREHLEKFIAILKQLIDAQERGDFILIADLLEYEVIPIMPVWKDIFGLILGTVDKEQ